MVHATGGCVCESLRYSVTVSSADEARTSICHCASCRRAFGTNFGLTTKVWHLDTPHASINYLTWFRRQQVDVESRGRADDESSVKLPLSSFRYQKGEPKCFRQDNGVVREFCDRCGAYVCEYGVRP